MTARSTFARPLTMKDYSTGAAEPWSTLIPGTNLRDLSVEAMLRSAVLAGCSDVELTYLGNTQDLTMSCMAGGRVFTEVVADAERHAEELRTILGIDQSAISGGQQTLRIDTNLGPVTTRTTYDVLGTYVKTYIRIPLQPSTAP